MEFSLVYSICCCYSTLTYTYIVFIFFLLLFSKQEKNEEKPHSLVRRLSIVTMDNDVG